MQFIYAIVFGFLINLHYPRAVQAEETTAPIDRLVEHISQLDLEEVSDSRKVHYLLSIAKSFDKLNRTDLSDRFVDQVLEISNQYEKRIYHYTIYNYADQKDDLKLAEEIAKSAIQNRDSMLDRLDLMKYRLGDQAALANYPRQKQTFYNAMDLAQTYIQLGEYEKAEKYVTGIKISEENDPRAVTGLILNSIAERYQAEGKDELSRTYIDKAFTIAGGLYYTGYCIEIDHRSMHGELTKDLDKFAVRGQSYQGHMGRELVSNLIRELIEIEEYKAAKQTLQYLEEKKYRQQYKRSIAVAMAENGLPGEAFTTVNEISDESEKTLAQIEMASVLWALGEKESAKNLIKYAVSKLKNKTFDDSELHYQALISLYAQMNDFDKIDSILKQTNNPLQRLKLIDKALAGYSTAKVNLK